MAFWMDPFLLVGIGALIAWLGKITYEGNPFVVHGAQLLTIAISYLFAIGFFLNLSVLAPVWRLLGAETGTEFMINGFVFGLVPAGTTWTEIGTAGMFVAILLFALYPVWLKLGIVIGRILVGRNQRQGGLLGLVRP